MEQGLSVEQARSQGHRFHDYWIGIPGQRGVKLDWQATWRNRIRDVIDRGTYSNGGSAGRGEPMTASDYIMAEHKKKDEKEAALKRHRVG